MYSYYTTIAVNDCCMTCSWLLAFHGFSLPSAGPVSQGSPATSTTWLELTCRHNVAQLLKVYNFMFVKSLIRCFMMFHVVPLVSFTLCRFNWFDAFNVDHPGCMLFCCKTFQCEWNEKHYTDAMWRSWTALSLAWSAGWRQDHDTRDLCATLRLILPSACPKLAEQTQSNPNGHCGSLRHCIDATFAGFARFARLHVGKPLLFGPERCGATYGKRSFDR